MIQIHPKRAFLNSEVVISNKGEESVIVEDSVNHYSFSLSAGGYTSAKFQAGEHQLTVTYQDGKQYVDSFVVEDALKFGGSERKNCFIFDENSWAVIVMKDRTYFFNTETKEQFVEHNMCPDSVEELNPYYLLFNTGKDCSLFSLLTMSIEKTFPLSRKVYSGANHCVLESNGSLYIYRLFPDILAERYFSIRCDTFIVDNDGGKIVYHDDNDSHVTIVDLLDHQEDEVLEKYTTVRFDGIFICFLNSRSILYINNSSESENSNGVYCMSLSADNTISLIQREIQEISSINGIAYGGESSYQDIKFKHLSNKVVSGDGVELSINVRENSGRVLYIKTIRRISVRDQKAVTSTVSSLFAGQLLLYSDKTKEIQFSSRGDCDYVSCGENSFILIDGNIRKVSGELCFSYYDDPYEKLNYPNGPKYKNKEGVFIHCDSEKSSPSNGFFYNKNQNGGSFLWLKTNKWYVGNECSRAKGVLTISGGLEAVPPRFFLEDGSVIPIPVGIEDIIALSKTCKTALFEKGGYFCRAHYSNKEWRFSENMILAIYDTVRVRDAVFCSDGDSFIYQKDDGMVLFDFSTGKETLFASNSGIKYNVNGYRPYCSKDYYSRPVIIDPLSHRVVNNLFLNQYRFSNVDGTVYCEGRVFKRLLKKDGSVVSDSKYQSLRSTYDYSPNMDVYTRSRIRQERVKYCKEELGLTLSSSSYSLNVDGFVDHLLVRVAEFSVIMVNGRRKEIEVGAPLYFLNYVAFSADSTRVAICGKYKDASGLCLVYDLEKDTVIHRSTSLNENGVGKTLAIWLGLFSIKGDIAYYDSAPNTYFIHDDKKPIRILGRSFLTFSPSGKLMALSKQGYTPYSGEDSFWGHEPSCDIFIACTDDPQKSLCHFKDHGSGIVGVGRMRDTIASASFSTDDKKILSVSRDGVVVVRNLQLDTVADDD